MPVTTRRMAREATRALAEANMQAQVDQQIWGQMAETSLQALVGQMAVMELVTPDQKEEEGSPSPEPVELAEGETPSTASTKFPFVWLLLLVSLAAAGMSLFFFSRWVPVTNPRSNLSSFDPLASFDPAPFRIDVQAVDRRFDILDQGVVEQRAHVDEFGDRVAGLEQRQQRSEVDADQLRGRLTDVDNEVDGHLTAATAKLAAATPPKTRRINWMSFDLGARALPRLSSPTAYYPGITAAEKKQVGGYGPNAVLQPWLEHEPRYCVSDTTAQLAVRLPRPIVPTELMMEYYPIAEVGAVRAAPRDVELWIPVKDPVARAHVKRAMRMAHPETLQDPANAHLLDANWVPIGRWAYDVLADSSSQPMHVPMELEALGVKTDLVLVRVLSNWGNKDTTCLVRARLFGTDKSGQVETLDG
ncbi:hypothetical protein MMC07_006948 [Pseudocyphellaria aurata]|nr:hypothetical protein [Pseudocyphellaria aurata]